MQQEFLKIREEAAATREGRNAKVEEAAKLREAEVRQAVDGLSVEGVAQSISALSVQISKALAEVSDNLISEVRRLATIREAVALESEELQRLHKIDIAATALDQLVQEYDSRKQESGAEISAGRAAWDAEVKARERAEKEYDENLRKQRQREADEYRYKKTLDRKKTQDKYDEEMRALEKKNREKQEALEKDWQERSRAIKEREEEYHKAPAGGRRLLVPATGRSGAGEKRSDSADRAAVRTAEPAGDEGPRSRPTSCRASGQNARGGCRPTDHTDFRTPEAARRSEAAGPRHRCQSDRRGVRRSRAVACEPNRDGTGEDARGPGVARVSRPDTAARLARQQTLTMTKYAYI